MSTFTEDDVERVAIALAAADHPEASGWSGKAPDWRKRYRTLARTSLETMERTLNPPALVQQIAKWLEEEDTRADERSGEELAAGLWARYPDLKMRANNIPQHPAADVLRWLETSDRRERLNYGLEFAEAFRTEHPLSTDAPEPVSAPAAIQGYVPPPVYDRAFLILDMNDETEPRILSVVTDDNTSGDITEVVKTLQETTARNPHLVVAVVNADIPF